MAGLVRRKWTALAVATLVLVVVCAIMAKHAEAYKRQPVATVGTNDAEEDDQDEEEDDDEDAFDFMSSKLGTKAATSIQEASCDAAGQCTASSGSSAEILSVFDRGLVTTKPRVQDILREYTRCSSVSGSSSSHGETLGYVTPWNSRGYDFAKTFAHKFDYIAPVWLQIREEGHEKTPVVTGTHDIDRQWVNDIRKASEGRSPQIVPRVVYERNRLSGHDVPVIISQLLALAKQESFDGFVFEVPISKGTLDLLLRMGHAFHEAGKLLLLVLIRSSNDGRLPVTPELMDQLLPVVHRFTMNAYDFQTPGPNAPYDWIQKTLAKFRQKDKSQILMGLPFYGYDNNDAIVGTTYIEKLAEHTNVKIKWDAHAHECHFQYDDQDSSHGDGSRHVVYYPCLQFLHDRLSLFADSGLAGAAVWELGQGLEFMFDLL